jgi:hypothetical protein
MTDAPVKEPKASKAALCRSGSGKVSLHGNFAPGGDAIYKSALISRVINPDPTREERQAETDRLTALGYDETYIKNEAALLMNAQKAEAILEERKWTKFLDVKRATIASKADKKAKAAAAKAEAKAVADANKAAAAAEEPANA